MTQHWQIAGEGSLFQKTSAAEMAALSFLENIQYSGFFVPSNGWRSGLAGISQALHVRRIWNASK
jgi:hypothetical protein